MVWRGPRALELVLRLDFEFCVLFKLAASHRGCLLGWWIWRLRSSADYTNSRLWIMDWATSLYQGTSQGNGRVGVIYLSSRSFYLHSNRFVTTMAYVNVYILQRLANLDRLE